MQISAPRKRLGGGAVVDVARVGDHAVAVDRASMIFSSGGRLAIAAAPPGRLTAPASGAFRYQRLLENSACGSAANACTRNQPLTPQASPMRPTSIASAG